MAPAQITVFMSRAAWGKLQPAAFDLLSGVVKSFLQETIDTAAPLSFVVQPHEEDKVTIDVLLKEQPEGALETISRAVLAEVGSILADPEFMIFYVHEEVPTFSRWECEVSVAQAA